MDDTAQPCLTIVTGERVTAVGGVTLTAIGPTIATGNRLIFAHHLTARSGTALGQVNLATGKLVNSVAMPGRFSAIESDTSRMDSLVDGSEKSLAAICP